MEIEIHDSLQEISPVQWDQLNFDRSIFLDYNHLKAVSNPEIADVKYYFSIFKNNNEPVGIAVFQIGILEATNLQQRAGQNFISDLISKQFLDNKKAQFILICGSAFATGEHGYAFRKDVPLQKSMNALCEALTKVLKTEEKAGRNIAALLIKDFYENSFDQATAMEKCGFRSFDVDHNMEMPILEEWQSFEDYLQSLNSKFRTKSNAAYKKSAELKMQFLDVEDIRKHQVRIQELYDNVHEKADFKIGHINATSLIAMKNELASRMIIRGYFLEENLVGFSIALDSEKQLEAFIVGIDYSKNGSHAIYSRMLYDYVHTAIDLKKSKIVFGRTAGEIKSTVGAFPIQLKCCIRHPGKLPNVLLKIIFCYVEPSSFPTRNPYKETTFQKIQTLGYSYS
ncbi:MAG: hypothetical protein R2809_04590 [Flavobacteriales bacterium]